MGGEGGCLAGLEGLKEPLFLIDPTRGSAEVDGVAGYEDEVSSLYGS